MFQSVGWLAVLGFATLSCFAPLAWAQPPQTTVAVPHTGLGEGFSERTGVAWGARGRGWSFSFGQPGAASPFGPRANGAGLGGGFRFGRSGFGGSGRFWAEQTSYRGLISQTPTLTVRDGYPGYFHYGAMRPFVVGYVPVVGYAPAIGGVGVLPGVGPALPSPPSPTPAANVLAGRRALPAKRDDDAKEKHGGPPPLSARASAPSGSAAPESVKRLADARASSAGRPAMSVDRAKTLFEQEKAAGQREAEEHYRRGVEAEAAGKIGAARAYYQMASRRADDALRRRAIARFQALGTQPAQAQPANGRPAPQ
ncbi:MAG: hypothetical protein JW809_10795 [Pirellulales bacterium]|nr:hypothetical protein [Pirellulales bacterium]